nr:phospholipase-like protein [Tanacetum cinerariifolium]GFB32988.1 phospholipase-like protein [Tanacetum cinerariifolium]
MGKEKRNFLTKHIMWLVDDFDAWNAFLWGEYMWEKFYNRTVNVVSRYTEHHLAQLKKNPNFNATYNLYGFAWAFKANVIPRGLAWSKVTTFEKSDYEELFGPMSNPNVALISSLEEMSQTWFKDSAEFIKGLNAQDGTILQDNQGREKCMEQHNGMCGDTEDGTFVDRVVG